MNIISRCIIAAIALLLIPAEMNAQAKEKQLAFPGAEGFGRYVTGGRGGKVYHVTTLEDNDKEGSFRYACNQKGARTIVFEVSGTIYLKSGLKVKNGDLTIAGQSAPGDGVCIADYPFEVAANNVIIRYMRFRLGNRQVANHEGDGLGISYSSNIMVDHCSVSWSVDECLSICGNTNSTVQWCIVAQPLNDAGHSKGKHCYAGNWGGSGASFHHNLIAHSGSRTPRLGPKTNTQTDERMDMRNNVIYNWGGNGCYGGEGMNVNIVNNYYQPGPATMLKGTNIQQRIAAIGIRTTSYTNHNTNPNDWDVMWHVWGDYYVDGNVNSLHDNVTKDNWTYGMYNQIDAGGNDGTYTSKTKDTIKIDEPIDFMEVTTHTAEMAYEKVLENAGCIMKTGNVWHRDVLDEIVVNDARNGLATFTGDNCEPGMVNNQNDAGGWPQLAATAVKTDTDRDGMPDYWEDQKGLDMNDPKDGNQLYTNGYTQLERYLNSIVAQINTRQYKDGTKMGYTVNTDGSISSGIEEAIVTEDTKAGAFRNTHIFSLSGSIVKMNADVGDYATLNKGIYIHKGKKIVIK